MVPVSVLEAPMRPAMTGPSCFYILSSQGCCQLLPSCAMPDRLRKPQTCFLLRVAKKLRTELDPKVREMGTRTKQGSDRYKGVEVLGNRTV